MNSTPIDETRTENEELDSTGSRTQAPGHVPAQSISEATSDPTRMAEIVVSAIRGGPWPLRNLQGCGRAGSRETPSSHGSPKPLVIRDFRPGLPEVDLLGDELCEIIDVPGGKKKRLEQMQKFARKIHRVIAFMAEDFDRIEAYIRREQRENFPDTPEQDVQRSVDQSKRLTATTMILERHRERRLKREQLKKR